MILLLPILFAPSQCHIIIFEHFWISFAFKTIHYYRRKNFKDLTEHVANKLSWEYLMKIFHALATKHL